VERWLREEVARAYDRWKADPSGGISPEDIAGLMRKRHEARLKRGT
jgi:antitoxin ParD1/3/4